MNERQQKWVSKVQACDFEIEYVKGKNNVVADALSRRPTSLSLRSISTDWRALLLIEYYTSTICPSIAMFVKRAVKRSLIENYEEANMLNLSI